MSGLSRIRDNVSSSMVTCLPVDCCFSFNWVLVIVPRAQHRKGGKFPGGGLWVFDICCFFTFKM
jgi:hypothetical protein